MRHEKILKREDHSVKIEVSLYVQSGGSKAGVYWNCSVFWRGKGKSKWLHDSATIDMVTPVEILEAKIELWKKIKPI